MYLPPRVQSPSVTIYLIPFTLYYLPLLSLWSPPYCCLYEFLFVYFSCLFICCFQLYIPHINEITCLLTFSVRLNLLSMIFSRSTHAVVNGSIYSFLVAEWCSIVCMFHTFFIQPSMEGHFGCLHVLGTMINAAVNIRVHICLQINVFEFFG